MGCFDEIVVPCPACGKHNFAQSKVGACNMSVYPYALAPKELLVDVADEPFHCECGTTFRLRVQFIATVERN